MKRIALPLALAFFVAAGSHAQSTLLESPNIMASGESKEFRGTAASFSPVTLDSNQPISYTWGGGNGDWFDTSPAGWNGGPPSSGDHATINIGTVTLPTNNLVNPLNSITIGGTGKLTQSTSNSWSQLNNLTMQGGVLESVSTELSTFGCYWTPGTVTVSGASTSSFTTIGSGVQFINLGDLGSSTGTTTFHVEDVTSSSAPDLVVSTRLGNEPFGNAAGLIKTGAGTMTLGANHPYTGGTTVNAGVLEVAGSAVGNGNIRGAVTVNNGAELRYTGGDGTGLGFNSGNKIDTLNINGGLVNSQGNMAHLFGCTVNMTGGELRVNGGTSDPGGFRLEWNHSTVNTFASTGTATISGRINLRSDGGYTSAVFDVQDGAAATDLLVSAAITDQNGTVGISKSGEGMMVMSGNNSYTGDTIVNGGGLVLAAGGSMKFRPAYNLACNRIHGVSGRSVTLDGQLYLDLAVADRSPGNIWPLIDTANLDVGYGTSFSVASSAGALTNSAGVWTIRDGSILWSYTQATGVLMATAAGDSYLGWLNTSWPGLSDASPEGDPDHDNIPNILEYVLANGDPSTASPAILPEASVNETGFVFTFWRRSASTADTTQVFQYGDDLESWTTVPLLHGGNVFISPNTPSMGIDEIVVTIPTGNHQKMFGRLKVASFDMSRLVVGQPEVIYTDAQMPYTMDASWASLREADGSTTLFSTAMGLAPFYFRHSGTPGDPLQTALPPYSFDYNGYNQAWPSGCWLPNFYQHSDGTLVGFVHREDLYPGNGRTDGGNSFFIGLAKSTDGGMHWSYLGDVIATRGNGATNPGFANIGGVPYLIVDGYVHLYFNEHEGPLASDHRFLAVARAKLGDVIGAVAAGDVPQFFKYRQGGWTEDGMTGLGSEVIAGSTCRNDWPAAYDFHSDAVYCRPLGRYLITVQTHAAHSLLLYSSADGVDWRFERNLDFAPGCMLPYSSFIGFDPDSSADSHEVGSEFYIYYTRKNISNYDVDTLCRIRCSIHP